MGEGFNVLQTADCKITYYQDEPGLLSLPGGFITDWLKLMTEWLKKSCRNLSYSSSFEVLDLSCMVLIWLAICAVTLKSEVHVLEILLALVKLLMQVRYFVKIPLMVICFRHSVTESWILNLEWCVAMKRAVNENNNLPLRTCYKYLENIPKKIIYERWLVKNCVSSISQLDYEFEISNMYRSEEQII